MENGSTRLLQVGEKAREVEGGRQFTPPGLQNEEAELPTLCNTVLVYIT